MKRVKVRVSFDVVVELCDDDNEVFAIEENSCPGTGLVGHEVYKLIEECWESNVCLFCSTERNGENKILEVTHVPGNPSWKKPVDKESK